MGTVTAFCIGPLTLRIARRRWEWRFSKAYGDPHSERVFIDRQESGPTSLERTGVLHPPRDEG